MLKSPKVVAEYATLIMSVNGWKISPVNVENRINFAVNAACESNDIAWHGMDWIELDGGFVRR